MQKRVRCIQEAIIMLKRKFIDTLIEWKNNHNTECLLVKGARQVGKTFIIREFGRQNYKNVGELNFFTNEEHREIFAGSLAPDTIYMQLSLRFKDIMFNKDTLIFLDEIQLCGGARTALKFLAEDGRCDVIASGSMLGIAYKETASIPVGYEKQVEMFAMDFEEFLWATSMDAKSIDIIKGFYTSKTKVDDSVNKLMLERMHEYMVVGGMPAVVNTFIATKNFSKVHEEQEKIIASYLDDIVMYAPVPLKPKVRSCYLSLPKQLAKENKKFQYSVVEKDGRGRKFETSLDWLRDAGIIKLCTNVSTPLYPLVSYTQEDYFKVYANDIGILIAMYGFDMKAEIYNNTLKGPAKGGIYENLIADILLKKRLPMYYYKPGENRQEIEFLYQQKGSVVPIEVKSGNSATYSLDEFIKEYDPEYGLKFVTGNVGVADKKITLPLYMAMFL
jgi:predicted AAA+ superfamily ATPase